MIGLENWYKYDDDDDDDNYVDCDKDNYDDDEDGDGGIWDEDCDDGEEWWRFYYLLSLIFIST